MQKINNPPPPPPGGPRGAGGEKNGPLIGVGVEGPFRGGGGGGGGEGGVCFFPGLGAQQGASGFALAQREGLLVAPSRILLFADAGRLAESGRPFDFRAAGKQPLKR